MAADDQSIEDDGKSEPISGQASTPAITAAEELRTIGQYHLSKASVSVNSTPSLPSTTQSVPTIPEKTLVGITGDQPTPFPGISLDSRDMDKFTGYDWLFMKRAAQKDGIDLTINSAFRTPDEQRRLIAERMDANGNLTDAGRRLGRAGPIDGNNVGGHLMGQALDIGTGLTVATLRAALKRGTPEETALRQADIAKHPGHTPAQVEEAVVSGLQNLAMRDVTRLNEAMLPAKYRWLAANAATYGFQRTVSSEPWHWGHPASKIITKNTDVGLADTLLALVSSQAGATAVLQTAKSAAALFLDRTVHAVSQAQERSARMARMDRGSAFAQMGLLAVRGAAALIGLAAKHDVQVAVAEIPPPKWDAETLKTTSFDYTTGLWGDKRKV